MAVEYKKNRGVFSEEVGGEDAEALLEWLNKYPKGKIDLGACTHLHPANLQVLMAARCVISVPPSDRGLAAWLDSAFTVK